MPESESGARASKTWSTPRLAGTRAQSSEGLAWWSGLRRCAARSRRACPTAEPATNSRSTSACTGRALAPYRHWHPEKGMARRVSNSDREHVAQERIGSHVPRFTSHRPCPGKQITSGHPSSISRKLAGPQGGLPPNWFRSPRTSGRLIGKPIGRWVAIEWVISRLIS